MGRRRIAGTATARQTAGSSFRAGTVNDSVMLMVGALVLASAVMIAWRQRGRRRQHAMRQLLDAADALESRLRAAREEIEAIAGGQASDPVRDAMREMLRQRLWLREHGAGASLDELRTVRRSIDDARVRIDQQLQQIERARSAAA